MLPEIKEYERTSTTVINAYVMPIVATYLRALRKGLDAGGIPARLLLMQSNGGLTTDAAAAERPMNIIESGPAGGVVGAQALARAKDLDKIITFDMGGTTAKASMVEHGEVARAQEYAVGAGHHDRLAAADRRRLHAQGAGDRPRRGRRRRRLARLDRRRRRPAGRPRERRRLARPGLLRPGRREPTITDANVLLGYINPAHLVGGALKLNAEKARSVFAEKIAKPLGMPIERAAYGAHLIVASNMIRAIKAVSTERGRDPREFALFAFGGNGPLFAAGMAASLGINRIVVPPSAGLFSSFGLLYADVEHHYARTFRRLLRQADLGEIDAAWDALAQQASEQLAVEGFTGERARLTRSAALHYKGQSYELTVPVPDGPIDARMAAHLEEAFGEEHERTYGHRAGPDEPVELVAIQLVGSGLREGRRAAKRRVEPPRRRHADRRVRPISATHGWLETPVLCRADLAGRPRRSADRRGIRRDLRRAARRPRRARRRRQHRDHALGLPDRRLPAGLMSRLEAGGPEDMTHPEPARQEHHDVGPDADHGDHDQQRDDERRRAVFTSVNLPRPRMPWMTNRLMPNGGVIIAVWIRSTISTPYQTGS